MIHHGAQLKAHAALLISGNEPYATTIDFIGGESSMFLIEEGSTVTKRYDGATDRLILESNGNVSLKSMSLIVNNVPMLGSLNIDSRNYELPINGNITINVNSGMATVVKYTVYEVERAFLQEVSVKAVSDRRVAPSALP